ncbi:MAG: 1,4-alpha-glucan branching protein GlgB [Acidobacteriaceae bacterium]|nr:1,4-alpha-glucan branching protein GlgB [Acidobacteriaceae bacterium]MBV9781308.1 1,4-alpha-glucan branching protein GlgB [Acidobacteriaceae bacterium]
MTDHEIEAITGGYHGDPFRILGPHAVTGNGKSKTTQWEIRAFLPQAKRVELVANGKQVAMDRIHLAGLFTARLASEPSSYKFRITDYTDKVSELDDPYRFQDLLLSDFDLHIFGEGTNYEAYRSFGAHVMTINGITGTRFAVWAPNAIVVSVVGSFNDWDLRRHPMRARTGGIWEIFIPGVQPEAPYKYGVKSRFRGYSQMKCDPYGFGMEVPPKSASLVNTLETYTWNDQKWMDERAKTKLLESPISVYEVHLGSWLKGELHQPLNYRQLGSKLPAYAKEMGYTHIELMPIAEHPYAPSWGYQVIGYFAPTARYGSPQDFMYFVDCCHEAGIGVIMDWVPAHFPKDAHGLAYFDGTALYEHEDPRLGQHRDWGTLIFNYGRNEVRSFLMSNAMFWVKEYHIDGLRVDAVASMLYLDYSRKPGEWVPNMFGGNENLEAIDFLRKTNELVHTVPGVVTVAEESTAFSGVSRPTYLNGLGFTMKWNMGWMHDMLLYFSKDPVYRKYHQNDITFSMVYAFTENFVLPISHDEVVYGKRALLSKMPGDEWQRFANCRAFLSYMYGHPGKKLLFMGAEIGQTAEWNYEGEVEWWLLDHEIHRRFQAFCAALNQLYRSEPSLYEIDFQGWGFEWIDFHDSQNSIVSFIRRAKRREDYLVFACNFTPTPHLGYRIGMPEAGVHREIFNSDAEMFGGSNMGNGGYVNAETTPSHGRPASARLVLPPLGVVVFKPARPLPPLPAAAPETPKVEI